MDNPIRNKNQSPASSATLSSVKGSVQKVNLVCRMIAGMQVDEALLQLQFCNKRVSKDLHKLLYSAVSNAENNHGYDVDSLYVSEIMVGKSLTLKRFHPRGRGRGVRVMKHYSKVTIYVSEKE